MAKYNVVFNYIERWEVRLDVEADSLDEAEAKARELSTREEVREDAECIDSDFELLRVEALPEPERSEIIFPDCEVNRLHDACPGRDISHILYCPYCDPEAKHVVCIDADEPRKNLMRQSEYTNSEGKNVFRFEAHDWDKEDNELSLHVAATCTDCGKKIMSQFEYTHDDAEWEEIKREREEEEKNEQSY